MTLKRQKNDVFVKYVTEAYAWKKFPKIFFVCKTRAGQGGIEPIFLAKNTVYSVTTENVSQNFSYIYSISQRRIQACVYFVLVCLVRPYITFQANVFFARVKNSAVYVTVLEMRLNIIYAWSIL